MNLQKLRNASLHELRVRASQRVAAFSERRGWSSLVKLPDTLPNTDLSNKRFFHAFHGLEKSASELKSRWPETARRIVEQADRICEGKFDLLGFKNLSFGDPIDWHFEPISGKRIPLEHWSKLDYLDAGVAGDKKVTWELNRHQYFMKLGQAYTLTGDEKFAKTFIDHLESWMAANPPKLGINWASSLEVAFRSISWLWALYFFKDVIQVETRNRALKFLYLNARHLESYLSTYFSPNTHLTGEALGLFYLGTVLPQFKEAKRWQDLGRDILIEQIPVHIKPDGVYFEQSSYYHRYTTDFYLHFLILSRINGITLPQTVENALTSLLDHLLYIARPDGTTPFFGDDDGGRLVVLDARAPNDFRPSLATGAALFARGDYKFVSANAAEELLWLLGVNGLQKYDSIEAHEPAELSKAFRDGGYFVMRDGWTNKSNYLLFDCGPHGALNCGHAHADALSFELAANGQTVLVDPGTYTYTGSKELRDWFRSSQAHNTITLDGMSSSVPNEAFTWKKVSECRLVDWKTTNAYVYVSGESGAVVRSIFFLKGKYWIIRDTLKSPGEHTADIYFHFDSMTNPSLENGLIHEPGSGLKIRAVGNGHWIEENQWVSHCYGQKEPAKVFRFSAVLKPGESVYTFVLL
ncbi:MAG TPA: alginate lyase family protein [Pyrinomonadaceae bacterium]|nr:alginate lyase family protein [Pyrinomonadaceae bacterium]